MVTIQCSELYKSYQLEDKSIDAVVDCNIQIEEGECVVITGSKDSGKSTLLRLLGGFERPSKGIIYLKKGNMVSLKDDELAILRRKEIGYLFHNDSIIPELTVHENIIMPSILARIKYNEDFYEDLTDRLHISGILTRYPKQLSRNQLQCVAYARALINQPNIILADEPTHQLYQQTGNEILNFLMNMVRLYHKTLIMVSQDPEVIDYADHIIKLNRGRIIEDRLTW